MIEVSLREGGVLLLLLVIWCVWGKVEEWIVCMEVCEFVRELDCIVGISESFYMAEEVESYVSFLCLELSYPIEVDEK